MRISEVSFGIFGFSAKLQYFGKEKICFKLFTYLAGSLFNFILATIFYFLKGKNDLFKINLLIGILNLLPIMPLDGGRILKEILKYFFGYKNASIIMIDITKTLLVLISLFYSIAILKIKNIAILFLIIYLWWLYFIEEKKLKTLKRVYKIIES